MMVLVMTDDDGRRIENTGFEGSAEHAQFVIQI